MNILVTGACGQLGREIRLLAAGQSDNYVFTDLHEDEFVRSLDICDEPALRRAVQENDISVIINCAAYTDVEAAEDNPEIAALVNSTAPGILARVMADSGGTLVHISTDYVFGAVDYDSPCGEDLPGNPTGIYGLTKLNGEREIVASGCSYLILRTSWLYSEFGKNFVKTILRLTSERSAVKVVNDQTGTPTYALDLAEAIVKIVSGRLYKGHEGIYNYSNEGSCSWFEFASKIVELAGNVDCAVLPCSSAEFPSKVRRPKYSVLDKTKIKSVFGVDVPLWTDSLEVCLSKILSSR